MEETLYFAYGSNINLEQMEHRCPDAQLVGPVTLQNYELQFRGSGFATVSPKKGSVVHGLLWKLTPEYEQALDRYEGYPRHYIKETVTVQTVDGSKIPVMAYIMAEPLFRQPALPSPYYYRAIQQGFEANGLPVKSLEEAWNRTIDEIWLGKVERPKNGKNPKTRKPER
ncbi:gamma-glutamylcyclotransferase family protein [Dysosmobacter sp.]